MGQKVNATGFRIGINKDWQSVSYFDDNKYSDALMKDLKIRDYIEENLKSAGVVYVKTKKYMSKILVEIFVARPGVVIGRGGSGIDKVTKDLSRIVQGRAEIKLFEVKKPEASAKLIAESIAAQLTKRIVPKFAATRELENAKGTGIVKGIKIWVAGRIKGAEIARTEKFQYGSIPLHTLRADIDYYKMSVKVPNAGLHGIKVWVYKGEK